MKKKEFKEIREKLKMTQQEFAEALGYKDGRLIRFYESGDYTIPRWVELLVHMIAKKRGITEW